METVPHEALIDQVRAVLKVDERHFNSGKVQSGGSRWLVSIEVKSDCTNPRITAVIATLRR